MRGCVASGGAPADAGGRRVEARMKEGGARCVDRCIDEPCADAEAGSVSARSIRAATAMAMKSTT
jgi:hypothetical protein